MNLFAKTLLTGVGGTVGALGANMAVNEFNVRADRVTLSAVGGGVGAMIAALLVADPAPKTSGTLSGPPLRVLGWP